MIKMDKIEPMQDTYVAFGSFDGVHEGHNKLLKELRERGEKDKKKTVVVSCFDPSLLKDGVLTTEEEKAYFIEKIGIDCFISYNLKEENLT